MSKLQPTIAKALGLNSDASWSPKSMRLINRSLLEFLGLNETARIKHCEFNLDNIKPIYRVVYDDS